MKFLVLIKKELKELINAQLIFSLLITVVIFIGLGSVTESTMDEMMDSMTNVTIYDEDNTEFTNNMLDELGASQLEIKKVTLESDDYVAELERLNAKSVVIIPKGFTDGITNNAETPNIKYAVRLESMAILSGIDGGGTATIEAIKAYVKTDALAKYYTPEEIIAIEMPVELEEISVVGNSSATISSSILSGYMSSQSTFVPLIIFLLVMYSSQMIIAAISNEKIDKTLETLLSAPVSRLSVLGSKMLAAAAVSALNAIVYMFAFNKFMVGMTGSNAMDDESIGVIEQLGLKLSTTDYVMVGIQMFLTILIALSISMILGALAKDVKSAQTLVMPIMLMAMVPFMLTMFVDVNTLPMVIRVIVYAIPFTHTFNAISNVMFDNTLLFWGGVGYQIIVLAICMTFAVRIFMTDKIFTISIGFNKKNKYAKKKSNFSFAKLIKKD